MIAEIETFNCLGAPITIVVRGKRNPKYKHAGDPTEYTYEVGNKADTLREAAHSRQNPLEYSSVMPDECRPNASEWAFVIEQLVAEGTL